MKLRTEDDKNLELDLYVHTYYSLLRSSGEVEVKAFEEAHSYCSSSLHTGALSREPDMAAFSYAAARLPDEIIFTKKIILGQSHELFEAAGYDVQNWSVVRARGRRRPLRYEDQTLAVFIASVSDIDDLVPIVTAFQIEWNKMHSLLSAFCSDRGHLFDELLPSDEEKISLSYRFKNRGKLNYSDLSRGGETLLPLPETERLASALRLKQEDIGRLVAAFGGINMFNSGLLQLIRRPMNLKMRMLAPSYSQYQRAAQRWWSGVDSIYVQQKKTSHEKPSLFRAPVYFVSSNTHALANLVGGYATAHRESILDWAKRENIEDLGSAISSAEKKNDLTALHSLTYYLLRHYIRADRSEKRLAEVRAHESQYGIKNVVEPGKIDVGVQLFELCRCDPEVMDIRLKMPGLEKLAESQAVVVNIDYPLGMAAYHLLSRLGQGVGEIRGIYVMGKAATLNGRVGDVMLSGSVLDQHSRNTFLFRNAFSASDINPFLHDGSVLDNQRAVTVRSAFLQNQSLMNSFYSTGHTVLEMEAGPFLSAVHELVSPSPTPTGEIVHLSAQTPFDLGIVHYASDTPYSRRQSLLSKSLSYFGVDSAYACAIAIARRILMSELNILHGRR